MEAVIDSFLQNRWFRPILVTGAILLSAFLAYLGPGSKITLLAVLALVGGVVVLAFLRWPGLGLAALIFGTMAVPFSISTGTQTRLNPAILILFLLLGLWIFHMVAYEKAIRIAFSRPVLPLIAFSIVVLLSFGLGQLPWLYFSQRASLVAQIGGVALFLLSFAMFLLVGNQVRDIRWLEGFTWIYILLGSIFVFSQLIPGLGEVARRILPRELAQGSLFWIWLISLAFSQAVFNRRLHPFIRFSLAGLVGCTFFVSFIINRDWTSGWLPPAVAVVVILWVSGSRWFWLAAAAGGAMASVKVQSFARILFAGDNEYSYMTRLAAAQVMFKIIKLSPVIGLGPANYYWYTPLFPILGYAVQFNSHNNYLDLLAQTGVLGLICFLWFAWEVGVLGWRLRTTVPDGFPKAFVYGALGGLAAMLVAGMLGDWVLPFIYNIGFWGFRSSVFGWFFLGGLMALEHMYKGSGGSATT